MTNSTNQTSKPACRWCHGTRSIVGLFSTWPCEECQAPKLSSWESAFTPGGMLHTWTLLRSGGGCVDILNPQGVRIATDYGGREDVATDFVVWLLNEFPQQAGILRTAKTDRELDAVWDNVDVSKISDKSRALR